MAKGPFDTLDNAPTEDGRGQEGRLLAGRYRIVRKLGEGGMGMVYLAEDIELANHKVAIKFIPPMLAGNARAVKSLQREALTAMQLTHPNIVRLHDLHTDGHQKFLVMEYVPGKTLDDLLAEREGERLPLEELLPIAEQIAAALDYAHSQKVLHRDLKPSNIMVAEDGTVRLLDFGIAREMKDSFTRVTGQETSGTLPYMSPEQLMGEKPSVAMDVYSFGAVLYECLAGHPPFHMGDIREQIKTKAPQPIENVAPRVNETLLSALSKDPTRRPRSADELVSRLKGPPTIWDVPPKEEKKRRDAKAPNASAQGGPSHPSLTTQRPKRSYGWLVGLTVVFFAVVGMVLLARFNAPRQRSPSRAGTTPSGPSAEPHVPAPPAALGSLRITVASTAQGDDFLARQQARLRIDGGPWREVALPHLEEKLACQEHEIDLEIGGYEEASTQRATVRDTQTSSVEFRLTPKPGIVRIICNATGAQVYDASGGRLGAAGASLHLAPFVSHELTVRASQYKPSQVTVRIDRPGTDAGTKQVLLATESGSIRITASSAVQGDDYLSRQKAQLRIDGGTWREVSLPHTEEGLSCESHQVEMRVSGYGQVGSKAVTVRDGEVSPAQFRLVPEDGTVRIASNAAGAEVFDDVGNRLGAAGAALSLPPFETHELTVKAARHKPAEITVRIDRPGMDGGTRQVVLEPQRIPPDLVEVANAQYASLDSLASGSREAQERQRRAVSELGLPLEVTTARTGIVFRLIPGGSFTMGSPRSEQDMVVNAGVDRRFVGDETQHQVTLTKPFYCGKYEVTQGQWEQVMGSNPSNFKNAGRDAPVEQVSWEDCQVFLQKLCQMEEVPEGTYRLLTEAEWEYACRAGTQTALYNGDLVIRGQNNGPALDPIAWYGGNSGVQYAGGYDSSGWSEKQYEHRSAGTHPVGQKLANAWGLYDMIGNAWEWCQDWHGMYPSGLVTDPLGPASGDYRVNRGGSWILIARDCRSAYRSWLAPGDRFNLGLRLARTTPSYP